MIRIRPYALTDVPMLFEAARESVATASLWLPWCHEGYSFEESEVWVRSQVQAFKEGSEYAFVILSESERFLGGCGLNALDLPNARANLGYWVRASARGQGIATEATRLLIQWAFQNTPFHRLEILAATGNGASLRVAEKVGGHREGLLRDRIRVRDQVQDGVLFSILRRDLRE